MTAIVLAVILFGDAVNDGLDLAGVLLSSTAIGSGLGITAAVLERKPLRTIERWGFTGTAVGFAFGLFLAICVLAAEG